jgi:exosome complex RNA-binding protein Rrp42 (RNase PH superfamily)
MAKELKEPAILSLEIPTAKRPRKGREEVITNTHGHSLVALSASQYLCGVLLGINHSKQTGVLT